jgi:hypothetical protein
MAASLNVSATWPTDHVAIWPRGIRAHGHVEFQHVATSPHAHIPRGHIQPRGIRAHGHLTTCPHSTWPHSATWLEHMADCLRVCVPHGHVPESHMAISPRGI